MKVAIYVRVSRIDLHPENQLLELKQFADAMNWNYEVFEEKESTRKVRHIKNKIFNEALQKKWDMIFIYKLDRWARSLQELMNDINLLKQNKVEFRSLKDNIIVNDDPRNMLMVQILGAFAEFERAMIRERTMAGLERARSQGKVLGRPKVSEYHKKKVLELYKQFKSINRVSKEINLSYGSVYNIIKKGSENSLSKYS